MSLVTQPDSGRGVHTGLGPATVPDSTWHDPGPTVAQGPSMPGIDYLKAMIARELPPPPIAVLMQFDLVSVAIA